MADKKLRNIITADTSQFKKEMKDARNTLKDFEKEGNGALSGIASMFGVSSAAIEGVIKNLGQADNAFKLLGATGENSATAMTMGMKALGASIAGLGIMAAVAAFKELNAQAANFEQRLQGVNLAAAANAARNTYAQTLYDASGAGNFWANFKENSKTYFSNNLAEIGTLFTTNASDRERARSNAERAGQLASNMVDLKREERALSIEIQDINNKIYEAQNKFKDASLTVAERKQAEATITGLINEKYTKQADLQGRMLANVRERNSLTNSTEAELDEEANLQKGLLSLQGQQQQELNAMLRTHNSINKAVSTTKQTVQETVSLLEQVTGSSMATTLDRAIESQINASNATLQRILNEGDSAMFQNMPGFDNKAQALKVPGIVKPQYDPQEWIDLSSVLADIIEDALTTVGDSIGQLIGDLATGGDAWSNFTSNAISAFGDMATSVGKIAISTGLATLGIKAALESLNPYLAIAAGTALVALGAAVKAGMSNIASGGGYSTSVASSAYTSGAYGATGFGREMEVKVTGTLTANGSQLVAVLNNENDRRNYTT
ncbi:MAG: hypothetical protein IK076_03615 [Bacteroidales bacterium]|nr:hypothetical protein [Bacteroidales bacterium]